MFAPIEGHRSSAQNEINRPNQISQNNSINKIRK